MTLAIIWLFGGCRPTDPFFPAESVSGWNTFSCMIGEHIWQLKQNRLSDGFYQLNTTFGGRTLSITADGRCDGLSSSFEVFARNISQTGTYPIVPRSVSGDSPACMVTLILADGYKIYRAHPALPGTLEITGIDTLTTGRKYIAARFSVMLCNIMDSTDCIEVTRGRFDAALN